ncbi:MAG: tetratricopeptide repeat protein, partial [Gammaproteobacteria bacterium]|nr:tetratricopeptide repeat protein [Gammaproteobacteria bacterium]
ATRQGTNNPEADLDYGRFLCVRDRVDEGVVHLKKVLDTPAYPRLEIVNMYIGECLMRKPDYTAAESYFRAALAVNPRLTGALYNMATLMYETGSYLLARAYLERYFEIGRETPGALLLAVKTELQLGADDLVATYSSRLRTQFAGSKEVQELEQLDE